MNQYSYLIKMKTQLFLACSSVVHFSHISWQKSLVTFEPLVWSKGSDLPDVTASGSITSSPCTRRCLAWQSLNLEDVSTVLWEVSVRSILVGLEEILLSVPVELDKTGSECRWYRYWVCPGICCSSLQTSWDKKEKFSQSSPIQTFSWFRSVRSFCRSDTYKRKTCIGSTQKCHNLIF